MERKLKILIVDDMEEFLGLLKQTLEQANMDCAAASSVSEACAMLANQQFDLLLLDWQLDKPASEVLRACRELHPTMPIVVMSGISLQALNVRGHVLMAGADSFLQKGFSAPVLVSHIQHLVKRNGTAPRAFLPERVQEIQPLEASKREYIRHVVHLLKGNVSLTAERLGIHRHTVAAALKDSDSNGSDADS